MNHYQVSLPWGGRSSRETSPEPHSKRSKPQARRPIMVVGELGEALPLVDRQESIWLLCCCPNASSAGYCCPWWLRRCPNASKAARGAQNASRICARARFMQRLGLGTGFWRSQKMGYICSLRLKESLLQ